MTPRISNGKLDDWTFPGMLIGWDCGQSNMESGKMIMLRNVSKKLAMGFQSRRKEECAAANGVKNKTNFAKRETLK